MGVGVGNGKAVRSQQTTNTYERRDSFKVRKQIVTVAKKLPSPGDKMGGERLLTRTVSRLNL